MNSRSSGRRSFDLALAMVPYITPVFLQYSRYARGVHWTDDAFLAHDRRDELAGRHVERRVEDGQRKRRPVGAENAHDLVRVTLLDGNPGAVRDRRIESRAR